MQLAACEFALTPVKRPRPQLWLAAGGGNPWRSNDQVCAEVVPSSGAGRCCHVLVWAQRRNAAITFGEADQSPRQHAKEQRQSRGGATTAIGLEQQRRRAGSTAAPQLTETTRTGQRTPCTPTCGQSEQLPASCCRAACRQRECVAAVCLSSMWGGSAWAQPSSYHSGGPPSSSKRSAA